MPAPVAFWGFVFIGRPFCPKGRMQCAPTKQQTLGPAAPSAGVEYGVVPR